MIDGSMDVKGGKQLADALKTLPGNIAQRALQAAVLEGAKVIRDEARTNYPGKSGRAGIIARTRKARRQDERTARVTSSGKRWYLKFIEFGRAAFKINARNKRALASGGEIFGRSAEIPAMPARPFMRPALDTKGDAAVKRTGEVLRKFIAQAAAQIASGQRVKFRREP